MKQEGHLGCCYLKGPAGNAANAILTTDGYNFRRILAWLKALLRLYPDQRLPPVGTVLSGKSIAL